MSKGRNGGRDFQQLESDVMFFLFFSPWNTDCIGGRAAALHMEHTRLPPPPPSPRLSVTLLQPSGSHHLQPCSPFFFTSSTRSSSFLFFFAIPLQSAMGLSLSVCVCVCVFHCHTSH